ncbi:hypothetical protein [Spongiactinospora sp. TRM90649]|uniref:hypothetical protein n=1 Tax=Spongiactinospora sp. TRM90649 TaxID=3031114 RepID=UPI0023F70E3B|nr:hypothetical protein [Spongiactinospora sp. TRM90649]MDF5752370.1 hypothetical protein [Spongiactinospora sp. TRM90649]
MRLLPRVILPVSAAAVLLTGCGELQEVSGTVDKAQACLEATKIAGEIAAKATELANNPDQLEKALGDAATKLDSAAKKAGDTTLSEALQGLANAYQNINITDVNSAVDAAQKAATDTAKYMTDITQACAGS